MIYLVCPFCKTEQDIKNKICKKCQQQIPQTNKKYKIVVWHNNKRVVKRVENLVLAKEIEAKIKVELVSGEYYDRRQKKKESIEFNKFFYDIYIPYAKQNKKTYKDDESCYRNWCSNIIGEKQLDAISQIDIEKIKKFMSDNNKSPRTIQGTLGTLRHVFNVAKNLGYYTGDNPLSKVKIPKINNKRMRFLSKEESQKLLELAKQKSQTLYEICALSLYTGMRFGEIANLHYSDIDLVNERIYIRDPKNETARIIYMSSVVKDILSKKITIASSDDLVFKNKNGEKYKTVLRKAFNSIVNKLGLNNGISDPRQKVVFHTLRHTFASWLAIQGTPIYTIKELMGHKSLSMTERYAHLIPDIKKEAIERLTQITNHLG